MLGPGCALKMFDRKPMPTWGAELGEIDFDNIKYFVRSTERQATTWEELPEDIKNTYDRLGIPRPRRAARGGCGRPVRVRGGLPQDQRGAGTPGCCVPRHRHRAQGTPRAVQEYFGTVVPTGDKSSPRSTPRCGLVGPSSTCRRASTSRSRCRPTSGSTPRTWASSSAPLIIADEGSYVHYVEGYTAPIYKSDSLHSAVVEIIVKKDAG